MLLVDATDINQVGKFEIRGLLLLKHILRHVTVALEDRSTSSLSSLGQ
jgi:hypothetical protein